VRPLCPALAWPRQAKPALRGYGEEHFDPRPLNSWRSRCQPCERRPVVVQHKPRRVERRGNSTSPDSTLAREISVHCMSCKDARAKQTKDQRDRVNHFLRTLVTPTGTHVSQCLFQDRFIKPTLWFRGEQRRKKLGNGQSSSRLRGVAKAPGLCRGILTLSQS
jgi:hypothetical protein